MTSWPLLLCIAPLAAAAWCDMKSRMIPNTCTVAVLACSAVNVVFGRMRFIDASAGLLVIGGMLLLCAVVMDGGTAIGGGDVKLCAALGSLIGTIGGLLLIALATLFMLIYASVKNQKTLPFAPFLFAVYLIIIIGR